MKNKIIRKTTTALITTTALVASLSALITLSANTSHAENSYFNPEVLPYFRLDSGWSHFEKVSAPTGVNKSTNLKSVSNTVVGAGVGLGINFGDKFRSDLTWSRHLTPQLKADNAINSVTRSPIIDAYFLNTYYEIGSIVTIFNPYIGAGVGVATVKDTLFYSSLDSNGRLSRGSEIIKRKNNFAYKFIGGSAFDLNERIKFDISYNYHNYGKSKSKLASINGIDTQMGKTHYKAHIISAGMRFGM